MTTSARRLILYSVLFAVYFLTARGNGPVSGYLMNLYKIWTRHSNQTNGGNVPFNASAVRAMYFTAIQKLSSKSMKLTVNTRSMNAPMKINRDEIHLFIKPASSSSQNQPLTIQIKDGQTDQVMTSQIITPLTPSWHTISLNGGTQTWFNRIQPTRSLIVEFIFVNSSGNGGQIYPNIGTNSAERPYLVVYVG